MKFKQIKEGEVKFFVPVGRKYDAAIFYNEDAELTRDISVCALQVFADSTDKKINVCDALSASGVRGLRYAKEVKGVGKVFMNDVTQSAAKLMKKNISLNKLQKKCTVTRSEASQLLRQNIYGAIDLDPFGPPVQFLDSTAKSAFHKGFVMITATDTSALAGAFPAACLRKYGIKPIKTEFYSELGMRILITAIIFAFARYNKTFVPVMAFPHTHYYRVFGRVEHDNILDDTLKKMGYVNYCSFCGERSFGKNQENHCVNGKEHLMRSCGPIYLGPINDADFIEKVLADLRKRDFKKRKEELKLIDTLKNETDYLFYYDLHHLGKIYKFSVPKFDELINKLESRGFKAVRSVFSDKAIRTNAKLKDILGILC